MNYDRVKWDNIVRCKDMLSRLADAFPNIHIKGQGGISRNVYDAYHRERHDLSRTRSALRSVPETTLLERDVEASRSKFLSKLADWRVRTTWQDASKGSVERALGRSGYQSYMSHHYPDDFREDGTLPIYYGGSGWVHIETSPLWKRTVYDKQLGESGNPWVGNRFILSADIQVDSEEDDYLTANITYLQPEGSDRYKIKEGVLVRRKGSASISSSLSRAASGAKKRVVNKVRKSVTEGLG